MAPPFPLLSARGWGTMGDMGLSPTPAPHFLSPNAVGSYRATKFAFQQPSVPGCAPGLRFKLSPIPRTGG